jgi:DNA-binding GntR family transcriptional regulator
MAPRGTYRLIADDLRQRVVVGDLAQGTMVPSEHALMERHNVSRGIVRAALAVQQEEGLIEPVPGRGRRVAGAPAGSTPTAAYERVVADLRRRLAEGEFPPSQPMPSEATLMAQFSVSRNTVRRAYQVLEDDGTVEIRHGVGAFRAQRSER